MHGFRTCLDDEELAGDAVLGPFQIHGHGLAALGGVVVLDDAGPAGELQRLVIGDGELRAFLGRDRNVSDRSRAAFLIDHADRLAAEGFPQDGAEAGLEGGFENAVFVRCHESLDDVLAEAVSGADEHRVAEAGLRVDGEHHAGAGEVRADHVLDADAQRDAK